MSVFKIAAMSALVILGAARAEAANLVTNGSFDNTLSTWRDTTGIGGDDLMQGGTMVPGWTNVAGTANVLWVGPGNGYTVTASPGNGSGYFLDLTGQADGVKPYGGVQQTIATAIGTTYSFSFDLGASTLYNNTGLAAAAVTASAAGASQLFTLVPTTANQWVTETLTFQATSTSTTISLLADSDYSSRYVGIDNVSVAAVPEPATAGLLLAGLAAGAVVRRRRR